MLGAILLSLACLPVSAAEWKEGLGPAKPYSGVPEIDLSTNMGYLMTYPRDKMPASHFCDRIEMYLPREDITRGTGKVQLFDENGEVFSTDFSNSEDVVIRPLSEEEMSGLMWGGGTCVSIKLPVSLDFYKNYYVMMDGGCFSAANGAVQSLAINKEGAWKPVLQGEFGATNLAYRRPAAADTAATAGTEAAAAGTAATAGNAASTAGTAAGTAGVTGTPAAAAGGVSEAVVVTPGAVAAPAGDASAAGAAGTSGAADLMASLNAVSNGANASAAGGTDSASAAASASTSAKDLESYGEPVTRPRKGDYLTFDLVVGGGVVNVVAYSENGSVRFDQVEYKTSQPIVAEITGNEVSWGLLFLDANGDALDVIQSDF